MGLTIWEGVRSSIECLRGTCEVAEKASEAAGKPFIGRERALAGEKRQKEIKSLFSYGPAARKVVRARAIVAPR